MSKRRKQSKGKRRPGSPFADHIVTGIGQHARRGTKLVPPLAQIPKMTTSSWSDDHMPEMLWAALLSSTLDRPHYLACLRQIAVLARQWFLQKDEDGDGAAASEAEPTEVGLNFIYVLDHTKLAELDDEAFRAFLSVSLKHPLGYAALRPLLLVKDLPGISRWQRELAVEPTSSDWNSLAWAVASTLDHQSEQSTDIRWFKLIVAIISGRIKYPEAMAERLEEIRMFPDKGDMRSVRPFIRSGEMMLRRHTPGAWISRFWAHALGETKCVDPSLEEGYAFTEAKLDHSTLYKVRDHVIQNFSGTMTPARADPRLDGAFGLVLYGLSLVEEIGMHRIHNRIAGRALLRSLAEACITLRYLAHKDAEADWQSFRVYGAGQAKLAFLKAQEAEHDLPAFIDEQTLHAIANEDIWQEFLSIDVGHWAKSNLRQLALECGAKELYDRYYDWSSAFIHAAWGAVRDTNFVTCHNPLHRLHRIPRRMHRMLNSVEDDAVSLMNEMLSVLEKLYPEAPLAPRVGVSPKAAEAPSS